MREITTADVGQGHVYVLASPACDYVKIGGTDYAPLKRINEINASEPYKSLGPWSLKDFRQVTKWRQVENALHYTFRSKLVTSVEGRRELFAVSVSAVSACLAQIDSSLVVKKPKIDRLFQDQEFADFLLKFFRCTAMLNWLDLQGAWTFSLFPATGNGRYYTLNIGTHEVAFATVPADSQASVHMFHMDRLIREVDGVVRWVDDRGGELVDDNYATGLSRSTSVFFQETLILQVNF